jgi:hypothetical protein
MKQIIPPINRNNQGADVTNLQDGLLLLLRKQFLEDGLSREQQV